MRRLYFETLEDRFMFSLIFLKLSLDFNLKYLSHFFIKFQNNGQEPRIYQLYSSLAQLFATFKTFRFVLGNQKDKGVREGDRQTDPKHFLAFGVDLTTKSCRTYLSLIW